MDEVRQETERQAAFARLNKEQREAAEEVGKAKKHPKDGMQVRFDPSIG